MAHAYICVCVYVYTHMYMHVICIYASLGVEKFGCMKILISKLLFLLHTYQIQFSDCSCSASSYLNVKHVLAVLWPGIKFCLRASVGINEVRIQTEHNFETINEYSFVRYKHEIRYFARTPSFWC